RRLRAMVRSKSVAHRDMTAHRTYCAKRLLTAAITYGQYADKFESCKSGDHDRVREMMERFNRIEADLRGAVRAAMRYEAPKVEYIHRAWCGVPTERTHASTIY